MGHHQSDVQTGLGSWSYTNGKVKKFNLFLSDRMRYASREGEMGSYSWNIHLADEYSLNRIVSIPDLGEDEKTALAHYLSFSLVGHCKRKSTTKGFCFNKMATRCVIMPPCERKIKLLRFYFSLFCLKKKRVRLRLVILVLRGAFT